MEILKNGMTNILQIEKKITEKKEKWPEHKQKKRKVYRRRCRRRKTDLSRDIRLAAEMQVSYGVYQWRLLQKKLEEQKEEDAALPKSKQEQPRYSRTKQKCTRGKGEAA